MGRLWTVGGSLEEQPRRRTPKRGAEHPAKGRLFPSDHREGISHWISRALDGLIGSRRVLGEAAPHSHLLAPSWAPKRWVGFICILTLVTRPGSCCLGLHHSLNPAPWTATGAMRCLSADGPAKHLLHTQPTCIETEVLLPATPPAPQLLEAMMDCWGGAASDKWQLPPT